MAMQNDQETSDINVEEFNTEQHLLDFDFQDILDSGYRDLPELTEDLEQARNQVNMDEIQALLAELPQSYPALNQKISGADLQSWIRYTLKAEDEDPIYKIYHEIKARFSGEDDDIPDLIREAIAYDELEELKNIEKRLAPTHILLEDLITAATIESFSVLKWLINHVTLNNNEVILLMESQFQDLPVFEQLYQILTPTNEQHLLILEAAKNAQATAIINYLQLKSKD